MEPVTLGQDEEPSPSEEQEKTSLRRSPRLLAQKKRAIENLEKDSKEWYT